MSTSPKVCWSCSKPSSKLLRCGRCKEATYCDKKCQTDHWKNGHKCECETLKEARERREEELEKARESYDGGTAACQMCAKLEDKNEPFLTCKRCRRVVYCSGKCQTAHWKAHKVYCKELKKDRDFIRKVVPDHKSFPVRLDEFRNRARLLIPDMIAYAAVSSDYKWLGDTHFVRVNLDDLPKSYPGPRLEIYSCEAVALASVSKEMRKDILEAPRSHDPKFFSVTILWGHRPSGILIFSVLTPPKSFLAGLRQKGLDPRQAVSEKINLVNTFVQDKSV